MRLQKKTRELGCARQPIGRRYPHTLRIRPEQDLSNDFQIGREVQRQNTGSAGYTGIQGIAMQDAAMTTSMGPIYDRSKEHLGTTDGMVITVRRLMIKSAKAHRDIGKLPPNVMDAELDRVRSASVILPAGADWVADTEVVRNSDGGKPVAYVIPT